MKRRKEQKQEVTLYDNFHHAGADQIIKSRIPEIRAYALEQSVDMALLSRPTMQDTSLVFYTEGITSRCTLLLKEVHKEIGSDSAKAKGVSLKEQYTREQNEIEAEITKEHHTLLKTNKALSTKNGGHASVIRNGRWATLGLIILSAGETMINASIFSMLTDGNVLKSLVAALSMMILLLALPHIAEKIISKTPNKIMKITIAVIFTLGVIYLLGGLADMRILYMNATGSTIADQVSKHSFVLFNTAYFITSLLLVLMYLPSKEVKEEYKAHKKLAKKKAELQQSLRTKRERLKVIPIERDQHLGKLYAVIQLGKSMNQIIESHHQSIIEEYIKQNVLERTPERSGQIPPVFLMERPQLPKYDQNNPNN